MPVSLDSGDRRLLIGVFAFLVTIIVLTALFAPPPQESRGYPSSYSPAPDGAKAAFLLAGELGYDSERWEQSPQELYALYNKLPAGPASVLLILAQPFSSIADGDAQAIRRFVAAGGTVLGTGSRAASLVPDASVKAGEFLGDWRQWNQWQQYRSLLPSPLTRDAPQITMARTVVWNLLPTVSGATASRPSAEPPATGNHRAPSTRNQPRRPASPLAQSAGATPVALQPGYATPLYGEPDAPVVVTYTLGKGQVIWWAAATPLTNSGLRETANLSLFLNALGPKSRRILWDEYFHGERASLGAYLGKTPLPWAGWQLVALFAAVVFTYSRRIGPLRPPQPVSRLSPLEFVETLGDLYRSAHAGAAAVSIAYQRLRFVLVRKLGMNTKSRLPAFCRTVSQQLGWPEPALLDTLSRAERAMRSISLPEPQALSLVQELQDYTARLEQNSLTIPER